LSSLLELELQRIQKLELSDLLELELQRIQKLELSDLLELELDSGASSYSVTH
jgi:hypothetical protein